MSKRYDLIGYCSYRDNETGKISDNFVGVLNEQDQKIADLEAKLAESEKESNARYSAWQEEIGECDRLRVALAEKDQAIESLQEINQSLGQTCNNDLKEIERLREQLANTDKLIAEKKKRTAIRTIEILKSVSSKTYENASDGSEHIIAWLFTPIDVKETLEYINREKFEFKTENQTAIAELEKVRSEIEFKDKVGYVKSRYEVVNYIDQQIKELKGEK